MQMVCQNPLPDPGWLLCAGVAAVTGLDGVHGFSQVEWLRRFSSAALGRQ